MCDAEDLGLPWLVGWAEGLEKADGLDGVGRFGAFGVRRPILSSSSWMKGDLRLCRLASLSLEAFSLLCPNGVFDPSTDKSPCFRLASRVRGESASPAPWPSVRANISLGTVLTLPVSMAEPELTQDHTSRAFALHTVRNQAECLLMMTYGSHEVAVAESRLG
jgi:hypothetical protein